MNAKLSFQTSSRSENKFRLTWTVAYPRLYAEGAENRQANTHLILCDREDAKSVSTSLPVEVIG